MNRTGTAHSLFAYSLLTLLISSAAQYVRTSPAASPVVIPVSEHGSHAACVGRQVPAKGALVRPQERTSGGVAILYSYFEKDSTQKENFAFFITHGIGGSQQYPLLREVVVVNSGHMCTPCAGLPIYNEQHRCCITARYHLRGRFCICTMSQTTSCSW